MTEKDDKFVWDQLDVQFLQKKDEKEMYKKLRKKLNPLPEFLFKEVKSEPRKRN